MRPVVLAAPRAAPIASAWFPPTGSGRRPLADRSDVILDQLHRPLGVGWHDRNIAEISGGQLP